MLKRIYNDLREMFSDPEERKMFFKTFIVITLLAIIFVGSMMLVQEFYRP